jgi:SAM-dependent methyltransferase
MTATAWVMGFSKAYERWCNRFYAATRATILPSLRNSQWEYRDVLLEGLRGRGLWLDLGAGHDFLPRWLDPDARSLHLEGWNAVGIDLDRTALARHNGLSARVHGDIERLPFADATFNLVTANMVLEHVGHPARLFAEVRRVLAPGGSFIVHTPNIRGYTTIGARLLPTCLIAPLARLLLGRGHADVYQTYYRANSKSSILRLAGAAELCAVELTFVQSSPQLIRIPPAMLCELIWLRILVFPRFAHLRPCLIAMMRREAETASREPCLDDGVMAGTRSVAAC